MKLDITRQGLELNDLTRSEAMAVYYAFGGKRDNGSIRLSPRAAIAICNHYGARLNTTPRLDAWLSDQMEPHKVNHRLSPHLYPHQRSVMAPLLQGGGHGAFGEAGFGKTMCALEAARLLGRTLIVASPLLCEDAYIPDWRRWYPSLRLIDTTKRDADQRKALVRAAADVVLVSPGVIGGMLPELLDSPWACVVLDESAMIRSPKSQITQAMLELATQVPYRLPMSALPAPNGAQDYWAQMAFIDPGEPEGRTIFASRRLGTWQDFLDEYSSGSSPYPPYRKFDDASRNEEVLRVVREYATFASATSFWRDPPSRKYHLIPATMKRRQRAAYDSMLADYRIRFDENTEVEAVKVAERLMKLREVTAGFVYDRSGNPLVVGHAKLEQLQRLLRGPLAGEQAVIWTQFKQEAATIEKALQAWRVSYVSLTGNNRESRIALRAFKRGKARIVISHPRTAGHGLRFDHAHHTIYMSLDYDADTFVQSQTRTWRPPQREDCHYWIVHVPGTVDEVIYQRLRDKIAWHDANRRILGGESNA